ncbi:MAG: aminoglycoside phosphotransferase family protein [Oscillospiraceae bacterium]|nr:aminoglycoside phosphotransferase family protein [Oscillospiraceae bacterium]
MDREMYAAMAFDIPDGPKGIEPYGSGHINDTFLVSCADRQFILQRINHHVFKEPLKVIENIANVTKFLAEKIALEGGDPSRETLNVVPAKDGRGYTRDDIGGWWRMYHFVTGSVSYDRAETPEILYQSAVAFGRFQSLLSDFPVDKLHEIIPNFHNTPDRLRKLRAAVESDPLGRVKSARDEIRFCLEREEFTNRLEDAKKSGGLPLRVTHNDTKLNNIMFDKNSGKPICVVDLDTVMPGYSVTDFGDAVRCGASTGDEDERDLSKVTLDMELYKIYTEGFLEGCGGKLGPTELKLLPTGAKMIALELGMRFLTDYLQGDTYFKIHRDGHNLDRCRTQLKLAADMEEHWDEMAGGA